MSSYWVLISSFIDRSKFPPSADSWRGTPKVYIRLEHIQESAAASGNSSALGPKTFLHVEWAGTASSRSIEANFSSCLARTGKALFSILSPYLLVINGRVHAENTVDHMTFPPDELIHYHSQVMTLTPGDVISTGTPGATPIQDGDEVECRIGGFEPLKNSVIDLKLEGAR